MVKKRYWYPVVQGNIAEREEREDGETNTKIQENNMEQEEGKNTTPFC